MAKIFNTILEMQLRKWVENNNKWAYGKEGFCPNHKTINHLVTLCVLMEESQLKGESLYRCFVGIKNAFDIAPRVVLWHQ